MSIAYRLVHAVRRMVPIVLAPRDARVARERTSSLVAFAILVLASAAWLAQAPVASAQAVLANPSLPFKGVAIVRAIAVQSDGKMIVAGAFETVDAAGNRRQGIARFNTNGTLDTSFNFRVTGGVNALAIIGNTLYVGGDFTAINSSTRNRIGAIDLAGLTVTAFDPDSDNEIYALTASGTTLYVGGRFGSIAGSARPGLAAFNGGSITAWDPYPLDANNTATGIATIRAIAVQGSLVYIGGDFTQVGHTAVQRFRLAAIQAAVNIDGHTTWNPGANNTVYAIAPNSAATVVYVAGAFTQIGANFASRIGIAALDASGVSNNATPWNPSTDLKIVYTLLLDSTTLYAGGEFGTVGGTVRPHLAALDTTVTSSIAKSFNPAPDGTVYSLALTGTTLRAGGSFLVANGASNTGFAGFDKTSGATTSVGSVSDDGSAWALLRLPNGKTLVGGSFYMNVNSVLYKGLIRLNSDFTLDTAFNPLVEGQILTMALNGSTVLIGGTFTKVGATARAYAAGIDSGTGALTAFNPAPNSLVQSIIVDGTTAYIGGRFTTMGGTARNYIAAVNSTSGALVAGWNPNANDWVFTLAQDAADVYAGGYFGSIGGANHQGLAKITKSGAGTAVAAFGAAADDVVYTLTLIGNTLYAGGNFQQLAGTTDSNYFVRHFAGSFDATNGALLNWFPEPSYIVLKIVPDPSNPSTLYLAGAFPDINVYGQNVVETGNAAAVDATTGLAQSWYPMLNNAAYDILPDSTRVLIGGIWTTVQLQPLPALAAFTKSTGKYPPEFVMFRKNDGTNVNYNWYGPLSNMYAPYFLPGVPTSWQALYVVDINGDGVRDIVWFQPSTGQVAIWLMADAGTVGATTFPANVGSGGAWTLAGVGDLNNDGRTDLVWRNVSGQMVVWYMSASGLVQSTRDYGIIPTKYEIRGVADVNGDKIGDIVFFDASAGQAVIYLMAANGTFTAVFPPGVGPSSGWKPYRFGDFDGDGKEDIFWRNESNGQAVIWYMNAGAVSASQFLPSVPIVDWQVGPARDIDFDGFADLMWYSPTTGSVVRWLFNGRGVAPTIETLPGVGGGWSLVP